MPAGSYPTFRAPEDEHATIYRYMDFAKFVWMLETGSLWFPRADKLEDQFEGSSAPANIAHAKKWLTDRIWPEHADQLMASRSAVAMNLREWVYVNCWHQNEGESVAMWHQHARTNQAVAIQSTYRRLCNCLPEDVFVGEVAYIDYSREPIRGGSYLAAFVHKRRSFADESEIRAVWPPSDWAEPGSRAHRGPNPEPFGRPLELTLGDLIEKVIAAPEAPKWFRKLVQDVTKKYGLAIPVVDSDLDQRPVF